MRSTSINCSPRVRGCSPVRRLAGDHERPLPAHVGLFPGTCRRYSAYPTVPRSCGAAPCTSPAPVASSNCSSRVRGCSRLSHLALPPGHPLPAHAGLFPASSSTVTGAEAHSPRVRGCSHHDPGRGQDLRPLPAHSGLVPSTKSPPLRPCAVPRTGGADPPGVWIQGQPGTRSPRMRGWSRLAAYVADCGGPFPITRGRSLPPMAGRAPRLPLPAHAGLFPSSRSTRCTRRSAPPRVRGCSRHVRHHDGQRCPLPAHAGLFPGRSTGGAARSTAPRVCGAVPRWQTWFWTDDPHSPRMRGSSLDRSGGLVFRPVLRASGTALRRSPTPAAAFNYSSRVGGCSPDPQACIAPAWPVPISQGSPGGQTRQVRQGPISLHAPGSTVHRQEELRDRIQSASGRPPTII